MRGTAAAVALSLATFAGCSEPADVEVEPRLVAEQARAIAIEQMRTMRERAVALRLAIADIPIEIVSAELLEAAGLDRALDRETDTDISGLVWLVVGKGPFISVQGPTGLQPITAGSGWLVLDARSGEVLAMGMP